MNKTTDKSNSTKILIVDDHPLIREGFLSCLQSLATEHSLNLTVETSCDTYAMDHAIKLQPDIVLLDILMPNVPGLSLVKQLRSYFKAIKIVCVSNCYHHNLILQALRLDVQGFICKDIETSILYQVLQKLEHNRFVFTSLALANYKSEQSNMRICRLPKEPLTKTELDALDLINAGLSNQEISEILYKSVGTIKNVCSELLYKFAANDRTELIAIEYEGN